jgi:hypothetical protein
MKHGKIRTQRRSTCIFPGRRERRNRDENFLKMRRRRLIRARLSADGDTQGPTYSDLLLAFIQG